ncbi:Metallo-dependent phosphatase-like protein [Lipomyces kononenkoae]|uniref:Metallo-dependent phosphatase-like protein n=1 Tax=Lipomyces kononenkoae TaxID=34357 RepID=A0ACC3SW77_LIPKO
MRFSTATSLLAFASAVLAQINIPGQAPLNPLEPLQHRLAYAGSTGMYVSWNTYTEIQNPTVYYGQNVWNLSNTATGTSITHPSSLTWNNHVKITGLQPDTQYYYIVSNTNCYNCSELAPYTFTTARTAGDHTPYTAAVVIDLGVMGPNGESVKSDYPKLTANDSNTMQSLARYVDGYDLLWHPGDIAYADTWLREYTDGYLNVTLAESAQTYESLLNQYYDELQPVTARKPYMVVPGNHESNCDEGGFTVGNTTYDLSLCVEGQRNFTDYRTRFRMPSDESGGVGNFWYSFDHGMVHYVSINTETDLGNGLIGEDDVNGPEDMDSGPFGSYPNEQIDWLEKDLSSVDRTKTPWVIVSGHRPWYGAGANVSGTICWNCKLAFEPLLLKYNVDMVFNGHIHIYERNAPIANGVPDPNELNNPSAPWYILNGLGGHYHGTSTYPELLPSYVRYIQNTTYGWSRLTFHNCTHLTHDFISSSNGSVLDSATLFKDRQCAATVSSNSTGNSTSSSGDVNAAGVMRVSSALLITVSVIAVLSLM